MTFSTLLIKSMIAMSVIVSLLVVSSLTVLHPAQASSSPLSISIIQQVTAYGSTTSKTSTISYNSSVTEGDMLILLVSERGSSGNQITSVTDSLNDAWTGSQSIGNMSYIFAATAGSSGHDNVSVKFTRIPNVSPILMLLEAKGISLTATPIGSTGSGTNSTSTVRAYTIPSNSLTVATTAEFNGVPSPTNTTRGFTEIAGSTFHGEYSTVVSGSSDVPIALNETGQFFECAESYL